MIALALLAPAAATVATNVQQHYASTTDLTLDFTQTVTNTQFGGKPQTSTGTMMVQRPSNFRANYVRGGKPLRDFIYDGAVFWMVDYLNKEATKSCGAAASMLPAATAFLSGTSLATTYNLSLNGANLVLVPKTASTVAKVELTVDPKSSDVMESIVTDSSGNTNDFVFAKPRTAKLAASTFTWTPVAGFKVNNTCPPPAAPAKHP